MRTLATTLAFAAAFAVSAAAQPQDAPPMPAAPPAPPPPAGAPATGSAQATGTFRTVDQAIKELSAESGERFWDCIKSLEYLRGDLAATSRRVKARNGGKIPSDQAGLIAIKVKRVGRQQQNCIEQTKLTNEHFTIAMRSLAGIEPNNHPGIPGRRAKIAAMREKFNDALKKLKTEGVPMKAAEADGGDSSDDSAQ